MKKLFVLSMFLPVLHGSVRADQTLIEQSKPHCIIVLANTTNANVDVSMRNSGEELVHVFSKIVGADLKKNLRVVREPQLAQLPIPNEEKEVLIYVGPTEFAKLHGIDPSQFDYEVAIIRTVDHALVLIGDDRDRLCGTYNATTLFLQKYCGARWLWPGELGEVIPKRGSVKIPSDISFRQTPSVKIRTWRDVAQNATFMKKYAESIGWTPEETHQFAVDSVQWYVRNRMQINMGIDLRGGHAYGLWFERFSQTHPDYFALQPCGQRDLDPKHADRVKICHSNPAVIDQIVVDIEEAFKKEPNLTSYSLSPNDGGFTGHCMCDRCKSWDASDGLPMRLQDGVTGQWYNYVSLSDRMVRFYNAVAERVTKKHPHLLLISHAYCAYNPPPLHAKLNPNVVISYVGENPYLSAEIRKNEQKLWEGWARTGCMLMWRPNWLDHLMGLPCDNTPWLAEDLRYAVKNCRLIGTDYDSQYHVWGGMGLSHYILAQLLWDVNQNADDLVQDYCKSGFGKAAPAVRDYFMTVRHMSERHYAGYHQEPGAAWADSGGPDFYDQTFFRKAHDALGKAALRAAGDSPEVQQRVAFLGKALEWTQLEIDILNHGLAYRKGDTSQRATLIEMERKRQQFYLDNKTSFVIFTASIQREERRAPKWSYPVPEKELVEAK